MSVHVVVNGKMLFLRVRVRVRVRVCVCVCMAELLPHSPTP